MLFYGDHGTLTAQEISQIHSYELICLWVFGSVCQQLCVDQAECGRSKIFILTTLMIIFEYTHSCDATTAPSNSDNDFTISTATKIF